MGMLLACARGVLIFGGATVGAFLRVAVLFVGLLFMFGNDLAAVYCEGGFPSLRSCRPG